MYCRNCGNELVGTPEICMNCGARPSSATAHCPVCGATTNALAVICVKCGASLEEKTKTKIVPDKSENTSGQGSLASIPKEIRGWNWGAFLWGWIWGVGNNVWIALLGFIPYVGIIMSFILGAKGSEWAWKNKRWDSIEHFKGTQRKWAYWGLGFLVLVIAFYVLLFILLII